MHLLVTTHRSYDKVWGTEEVNTRKIFYKLEFYGFELRCGVRFIYMVVHGSLV